MSASSTRRHKDRGGGGDGVAAVATSKPAAATFKPSRSVTPLSTSRKLPSPPLDGSAKFSADKENRRSTSCGSAHNPSRKPAIRPVPRVDKASLHAAADRKSTSSAPRGRSSSPSEFGRSLSDISKSRRVSVDRITKNPTRDAAGGGRFVKLNGGTVKNGVNTETQIGSGEKVKACTSSSVQRSKVKQGFDACGEKGGSDSELKIQGGVGVNGHKVDSCPVEKKSILKNRCEVLGATVDKGAESEGVGGGSSISKCPSRLHEKLDFLEGKVKRIASDIKKTKEMLDLNNLDASKVIILDIQDKISGIEKAIVNVASDGKQVDMVINDVQSRKVDSKLGLLKKTDASDGKQLDMIVDRTDASVFQSKKMDHESKSMVKGLNTEELEARLFPHHKLLRNRTMIKESSGNCLGNESQSLMVRDKVLSPVDENSIAVEFLASLNKDTTTKADAVRCCEVQEADGGASPGMKKESSSSTVNEKCDIDLLLAADEKLEGFDDQENMQEGFMGEETDEAFNFSLKEIGNKTATGGWFVSEGEAVLLAHDDGSCTYYDIANCEEKAVYMSAPDVSPNIWRDCWVIRAPGSDGCSARFVVAASAGNTVESGFCSWDFYTKEVRALQIENGITASRTALRPLPNNIVQRRNSACAILAAEPTHWWYKPCGPLIISTSTSQRSVKVFDVRDGDQIMKWDVQKPVLAMDHSSPLQWRNRGKVAVAEAESISLWDVNSLNPQALHSVASGGRKITALHVSNTDAELGGGVRKRVSSSEAEGNDGVFCTSDSINVMDFRQPSGVGLRIPKHGVNVQSVFSRGDSIFLGCTNSSSLGKKQSSPLLQQFSLRRQGLFSTYALPESNAHSHHAAITQVWGNSDFVMGVCGLGLHVFDAQKDDALRVLNMDFYNAQSFREVVGPDDLYCPSFDYLGSRALLISRDRPAMWRHLIA